jgi:4-hydroxythreonine-4-phosphate dehydrogenase
MSSPQTKPIAITMGDPAGIGPEIIAKAFASEPALTANCFVAGDVDCIRRGAAAVAGAQPPLAVARIASSAEAADVPPRCIPVLQVGDAPRQPPAWGEISEAAGRLAAEAVLWAARAALRGEVAAVVTAPLHKEALHAAGLPYPGHTELLQAEAAAHAGVPLAQMPVRMMLANEELRTVLVSIHVALREALDAVTPQNVRETLRITDAALAAMLGKKPRIAVAGLNPHAGEGGLFGREEIEVIAPAIGEARAAGMDVHGPYAPDTIFMRARRGEFDAVVAMYHDQGLIPVKYLGVEQGVNVTLGLPLVRTSPDHGTAFDIAGTGQADAASLVAALRMAKRLAGIS